MVEINESIPLTQSPIELLQKVDLANSAILVVDIQNDWDHEDGARAKTGIDISNIQNTVPRIDTFLKDVRSYHVPIIHIRTTHDKWNNSHPWLARFNKRNIDASNFLSPGTWGAEFYKIIPQEEDYVIDKHRYSAFFNTDLDTVLRCTGTKTIVMTGFATNICVQTTAVHGFMMDYYVVVLADCTACINREDHIIALRYMGMLSMAVTNAETLLEAWRISGKG